MSTQQLNCPKCGQVDMVQKVSAIFSGGVTAGTYSGPSVAVAAPIGKGQTTVAGGYTTLYGSSQSLMSNRLAPPPKPSAVGMSGAAIAVGAFFLCSGAFCSLNILIESGSSEAGTATMVTLALIGIGIAILVASHNAAKGREAKAALLIPQWEKALARWNELYFCARDDGVFDPNERVFVPTAQTMDCNGLHLPLTGQTTHPAYPLAQLGKEAQ